MAYHGYIKTISSYAKHLNKKVKILEIGVDTGISLFGLINNLNILDVKYEYSGVDIKIQGHVNFHKWVFYQRNEENKVNLIEQNSLVYLKDCNELFDIILIDGDHNYETVSSECQELRRLSHKNTLFVFDDYYGKYSLADQFYYEKEGYENNNLIMVKETKGSKQGVKTAVDEFIEKDGSLQMFTLMQGEPVCVIDKTNTLIKLEGNSEL